MKLEARALDLPLAAPFRIALKTWDVAENVFCVIEHESNFGVGEVCPDDRWGETTASVLEQLEAIDLGHLSGPFDLETAAELLPAGSARCALDLALHDLAGKTAGVTVRELLGLGERQPPETSVTVGIDDPDAMRAKAERLADHAIIKTKVGFDGDVEVIEAMRSVFPGRIRVDANEGWSVDEAIDRLQKLARFDVELCEQPIAHGDHGALAEVTAASPVPVYADEDVGPSEDVGRLAGVVHGVNLKLRKTGGIREMVKAINTARALGLGVMIGCDLESGIATSAAAQVGPLADFVDIDGPTLLKEDPFPVVTYDRCTLHLPTAPGLGSTERPW